MRSRSRSSHGPGRWRSAARRDRPPFRRPAARTACFVELLHRYARENGVLRGASFETDYASFLAWRDWGCPGVGVFNVFAAAALQSAAGAFLLGQMAPFTSSAGRWVFPCDTPNRDDISSAGMLDLCLMIRR